MTNRERDLSLIYGINPKMLANRQADLKLISEGILNTDVSQYGIRIQRPDDSHWWDTISSLMQSKHETYISSLNDDNRNDEKEIEILEDASSIIENGELDRLRNLEQLYTTSHASALNSGDTLSAKHYEDLVKQIREEYYKKSSIVNLADSLVNSDKKLIQNGHNPILETIGEVFDATATGAGIGAAAGSPTGIGAIPGGIIGAMSGLLYGTYDVFSSGRNKIDRSAYSEPLSDNKIENYRNSIASRQSYKDFRSKLIEDELEDLFYWKTQYPVSDYYRYIESTGKGNYLYYNLPGIVGSSFSDTKDAGQQLVGTYGAMKLASKVGGPVKYGLRAVAFINALRNGWQQSLNENHAEVSEVASKKVIDAIKENKELHEEMLNGARQVAVDKYGLTESEAKDLIDDTAALMMYQGSVGGLNPRALTNNYEYYKAARQVGDSGADTQFVRDMMATAGTDALEAALMITPYGAFAKKSKIFGRAIAGAAIGSAAGQFFGFGVGGSAIGGILGGLAAQNRMARKIWSSSMRKTQAIEDRFLPRLERQIMFDKGLHAASAFGVSSLAEAAEEGVQYLNSLDAERILNEAKDDDALGNISSLFINDLKKRGEVFNAVLSQIDLTDSPYQSDQEFWQNWKGGLMLGGLMTGATVSLQEAIGIKKAYQTAKFLQDEVLSSAVANRVASQDAILKGAAFAKYGANGDINPILEIIERAKNKNKNRINTVYSDQDFDDLSLLANRIISKIQHKAIKQRLKLLGYELGSEEANYAIAINDYYQLKTRENRYEESQEYGEKIALQNDPNVIEALNTIAGPEPVSADSFEDADDSSFTYKVRGKDGSIEERIVSNRQRLMLLHQNTAELIAVAQLLKDLQDVLKVQEFAKSKGIAFSKALVDSTISLLKDKFNLLKNDVELYANEQFDSQTTSYDLLIEHLKGYLLDQTSGLKLVDLYRNSVLRMLNQRVYTNIIKSIAIDTDIDATNKEVLDASKNMTKRFIDNVLKNKSLLEILDYNIETDSESALPTEQELASGSSDTDSLEPESVEPSEEREDDRSWFLKMKDRINRFFFNDDDTFLETDEEEPILIEEPEPEVAMLPTEPQPTVEEPAAVEEKEPEVQEDVETPPDIIPEDLESAALPQDPQEQVDSSTPATNDDTAEIIPDDEKPNNLIITEDLESVSIPEDSESAIIIEDEDQEDLGGQIEDKQLETINMLSTAPKDAPRKLIDGWYVDKDGKIIPSDKMYMMNPVETPAKRGADFAKKYRLAAALIRYDIHRYILDKSQNGSIRLKLYIAKILKTADPVVVDTITKAIQNGDQNAVKLIVIQSNPRAWDSYYTNEFFRDAARKILNGQPIQRPEYIDKDAFKKFCREVILYKNRMQTLYGYKFVTQVSPFTTKIDGEDVIADPDFIAVDRAGNAHIVNVYTIANYIYLKRQSSAEMYTMQLENTENLFSLDQERNILADILMKAIRDGGNVIASSAMLLPIVVDGYTAIHRLYLGKLISLQPNDESMSKYIDLEDQLLELKELLVNANEKAKQVTDDFNNTIDSLHKYRAESKRSGYRLRKKQFVPDKELTSIAETYAQLDKALEAIQSSQKYYADHMAKEVSEMEAFYKLQSNQNRKSEIADRILRINNMPDETQTSGVLIEIIDGDEIINNSDIITNGVAKATLQESSDGGHYIKYSIEYKGKSYSIRIYKNRDKKYGKKNGDIFKLNEHPNYTAKMRAIVELLSENPGLVLTFDLQRSFIKYGEDAPVAKPRGITEKEGLLSKTDVENLGIQQNDGKIVSIGFYDKKTGVIQTGQNSQSATLAHAPEGEWWLNQMFLVIKQKHLEERKTPDRTVAIPLIRKKFDKKLARFIATCYKVIAETNHQAGYDSLKKREFANQMLHLFISERKVYKKGEQELPNIVYINGDAVRVNGVEYYLLNKQGFEDFVKALQSCEIMPNWNTFNSKFKNLASGPFSQLYDHFSTSSDSLKVSIDGIDSGLEITKNQFDNDTLCQWLVKNLFFASKHYVAREPVVSIHNIKVVSELLQEVKDEEKQNELVIKESKPVEKQTPKEESIVMTEEEFNKLGLEEVDEDEEDEEDDEYASPIIPVNGDFTTIRRIKTSNDVIKTIRKKYPRLAKLLNTAISKIGLPDIKVVISDAEGETAMINGVLRTKLGNVVLNKDNSWTITIFRNANNPIKTLAHETVHIFTLGAINKNSTVAKACKLFYQYCKDSFTKDEQPYGFKSFKEFIAEFFVNDEFRDYLKLKAPIEQLIFDFAVKNIPQEHKSKVRTLYDSIVSLFSKIWQKYILRQSPSLYSLIYDTMSKLFGEAENIRINGESAEYAIENHVTHQKITLLNCKSRAQLKAAIDGIMTAWILHENITALGKNIDKLNFSTSAIQKRLEQDLEFSQWYQRTFTYSDIPLVRELTKVSRPTREDLKTEDNPEGFILYEKKVKTEITIQKKDGTTVTKTVKMPKTFTTVHLDNWDIMTPIVDEFMSDMRIETRKTVQLREEDNEMEQREEGRNVMGELLTESYEISPFDRASREVKWMFSTVPYGKVVETQDGLEWEPTGDNNEFGMNTFMPFRNVYGRVLYYTANCTTTELILNKFYNLAHTGPDKAMFLYLYKRLSELIANRWKPLQEEGNKSNPTKNAQGLVFDANIDSTIVKVIRALRQQLNDFIWATSKDITDKDGNKLKQIDIRTTLYQKKAIETTRSWKDQLATGMSDVLKYDPETQTYKFKPGIKINVFKKIYSDLFVGPNSFISAYNKLRKQDPEDVILDWLYLENPGIKFSEITADDVKTYLHNALLHCGVDISEEILDQWLLQIMEDNPTITTLMDALYAMLSDQHSNIRPSNFFARLANVEENGHQLDSAITVETITIAFNSGFVKELANKLNEYDLRTQGLMTVAAHNNQYYIVSEPNYVNDVKDIINSGDRNDKYIQMLMEDSFASGSVIVESLLKNKPIHLDAATFVGMKTENIGDQGRDYFEIELNEDIISKLELLQEGFMLAPTISDKKTYHVLRGIPLVGMLRGVRSNSQCYSVDTSTGQISIIDLQILDRFITYFKSERDAVEKAVAAYENKFYKNNPGKKIANYSDKNGLKFSSFCCLPLANGDKIYLNQDTSEDPRVNLNLADERFFKASKYEQRAIILRILLARAQEEIKKIEEVGLIKRNDNGNYENVGLDGATILEMAERRVKAAFGDKGRLSDYVDKDGKHAGPRKEFAISSAIREYCLDCAIKHLMSMLEYLRLFSGSKSFYKWKTKGKHVTDISVDYTKRRGGDISTGGVNIFDIDPIAGMEELGTYRCIEVEDYLVESNTLSQTALILQFLTSELVSAAHQILSNNAAALNLTTGRSSLLSRLYQNRDTAEKIIFEAYSKEYERFHSGDDNYSELKAADYATGIINVLKEKAKANAMQYFRDISDKEDPINVADGATYITDRMCERLLREEGKYDDDMKYAFEVLRGEHGQDVLSEEGRKLYKSILNVIIGTLKYTATGFRKSDDGQGGTLMTPYYNKTALFPVFEQIAYGKMGQILQAMRNNNVDVMMMTSAVKTGSQGAITLDQTISGESFNDHTYIQEIRFLRKQLNTDPNEREEMNLGTQTIKIALSNLRADDNYVDPFTGKTVKGHELYSTIMRCYNILTDIGYEQVMMRFAKKRPDGTPSFENSLPAAFDDEGNVIDLDTNIISSIPDIDEEALSTFLHEELMSRDANDNMFDAIAYDKEADRLAAPMSAISQSGWIDSILSAYISKTVIDTKSPGAAYILRSVFAMEGEAMKMINDGEDLKLVNEDGSMDAVISIDFFEKIIPDYENKTFEEARQWLIEHKLVGKEAKTYTISYRIPTLAQASINALKFVDVVPIIRDSIILPKDFTRLTGSDFDIDKLFLSRMFINPETVNDENNMFTFFDNVDNSNKNELLKTLHKAFINKLFLNYITLLMDKNSANTKYRSIDADTDLWKDVYKDLYPELLNPVESMQQDTIAYQTEQKNNFVVGKIGIGPFALNNNNHIYTMLYNISVRSRLLNNLGPENLNMSTLYRGSDIYGNSIMSWLSGGINAHVDIAKDPFITKLNINKYTYNICNFLLRSGFGRNALWFLNQSAIKELARRQNNITGQYLKTTTKSLFDALKDVFEAYKNELAELIPEEVLNKTVDNDFEVPITHPDGSVTYHSSLSALETALGRPLTIKDVLLDKVDVFKAIKYSKNLDENGKYVARTGLIAIYSRDFERPYANDMVEKDETKSMIYNAAKYGDSSNVENASIHPAIQKYMSIVIFDKINSNEAKICSDVVKFTKIDTKKHGSTIAAQLDYRIEYLKFIGGLESDNPKVLGMTEDLFGISDTDNADVLGSLSSINLHGGSVISNYTGLPGTSINQVTSGTDITEAGYVKYNRNEFSSFIHNKTRKAINSLTSVLRHESVESTYGFEYIWRVVKNDFGKSALTEDMQTKLRSVILGAIKSLWVFSKMKSLGIDPISLFKDGENTFSLAHELYRMKTLSIRYTDQNHVNRKGEVRPKIIITTVGKLFKDNELLKILHDGHSKDEYSLNESFVDVLDFIKVHVPFTDDTKDSNKYIDAWRQLYLNDLTKDFAIKLMFYSFITSNDSGGSNLFKYVPFEMLKEYGLFEAERNMISRLNDLAFLYSKDPKLLEDAVRPIVDRVETILCEDFDFSLPYHLESIEERQDKITGQKTRVPVLQYTGFASKFGKEISRKGVTEKCDRIPYIFIPARINAYNGISMSKTVNVNRPYIRVYNPVRNYENEEKYFIYKRVGEIFISNTMVLPIYKLVNSSMYTLGQYKVYNYDNEMPISSTRILKTINSYVLSENYSIDDIDGFIGKVLNDIEAGNLGRRMRKDNKNGADAFKAAAAPLYTLDETLDALHKKHVAEVRIFDIRTKLLNRFEDNSYIEFYKNQHNTGKANTIANLNFVKESDLFTEEEKSIADQMLTEINRYNEILEQIKENKKQPTRQVDPRTYHMHSGGAFGSDTAWGYYAQQYGIPDDPQHISHYYFGQKTPTGNVAITQEQFFEGLDKVFMADQTLHRFDNMSEDRQQKVAPLLARNWMQVKNSDSIFAIGEIKYGKVDGGTGWAVLMAIDAGKPVHVFNLSTEQWFTYSDESRTWVVENTPKLTKNFAGIGTRTIDKDIERKTAGYKKPIKYVGDAKRQAAIDAINAVYRNTFGELKKEVKPLKTSLQTAIEKAEGFIGETNGSVYLKQGDKFVLKSGTLLLDTLKTITDRGHNPGKWSFGDDYDGQVSYNIGYESGTNAVMSVTNRDLYDEGWMPSTILVMREDNRIGNPLDYNFKLYIDQFGKDVTFLVSEKDKPLLEYLDSKNYKYEIYDKSSTEDSEKEVTKTVQDNGKIRLSLSSHTDEKPRQIVLEPQGDNKYYVHIRIWDGEKVPGKISDEDKQKLFDALYNELPEGAEILLPKSGEGYYATRGTIAAMQRLSRDNRFTPGTKGVVKYEDKDGSIKEYLGTSFIKTPNKKIPQEVQLSVDPESWSKKEGWSVDYFNKKVAPNIDTAWLIEYELVSDQEPVTSDIQFTMYFSYGNNKRSDVQSTTTFDAILNGERTATTRYEGQYGLDAWKSLKAGDVIEIRDTLKQELNSRTLKVRITVPAHKLSSVLQGLKTTKKVSVSTTTYTSESVKNPRTAVVFTENMQAEYARRNNTPSSSTLKVNVTEGASGTNQAVVRMSNDTTYNPNAFGLIVKKYQQNTRGEWFYDDRGNFQDTDSDFTMFKDSNEAMFDRLSKFDGDTIIFPASAAMGKAALPKRFAEWLAQELYLRYGLFTVVKPNPKYQGKYGIYIYLNSGAINIYSKSKVTITNLSNFEHRRFKTELAKGTPTMTVDSVEHAFLMSKLTFAWQHGDVNDQLFWQYVDQMKKTSGSEVKAIGRSIPMFLLTVNQWDNVSDTVLEVMMLRSFRQNPEAAAELLRTGNAELTHNYDNGNPVEPKTPKRFGNLLSKVRSKLRDESNRKQECK